MFLDFVWLTTRTPRGAYVRRARRNRIDPHGGVIERLGTRTGRLVAKVVVAGNALVVAAGNLLGAKKKKQKKQKQGLPFAFNMVVVFIHNVPVRFVNQLSTYREGRPIRCGVLACTYDAITPTGRT